MRLDIENLLKHYRQIIESATDAVVCAGSIFSVAWPPRRTCMVAFTQIFGAPKSPSTKPPRDGLHSSPIHSSLYHTDRLWNMPLQCLEVGPLSPSPPCRHIIALLWNFRSGAVNVNMAGNYIQVGPAKGHKLLTPTCNVGIEYLEPTATIDSAEKHAFHDKSRYVRAQHTKEEFGAQLVKTVAGQVGCW